MSRGSVTPPSPHQYGFSTAPHLGFLHRMGSYSKAGGMPSMAFRGVYLTNIRAGAHERGQSAPAGSGDVQSSNWHDTAASLCPCGWPHVPGESQAISLFPCVEVPALLRHGCRCSAWAARGGVSLVLVRQAHGRGFVGCTEAARTRLSRGIPEMGEWQVVRWERECAFAKPSSRGRSRRASSMCRSAAKDAPVRLRPRRAAPLAARLPQ